MRGQASAKIVVSRAGVLKRLLGADELAGYQVAGLSGTSGGAVCALLAWYACSTRTRSGRLGPLPSGR
jgi:predicted acylesterase/phospholipase RssA